jgi:hypothetical protein
VKRRQFIAALGRAATWLTAARAQPGETTLGFSNPSVEIGRIVTSRASQLRYTGFHTGRLHCWRTGC